MQSLSLFGVALLLAACSAQPTRDSGEVPAVTERRAQQLDGALRAIVQKHRIVSAGVGVITDGELTWTGYYGEQSPGVPTSRTTQFDVASIAKTVAGETILRLADAGLLSLDEPIAPHWTDPDLADDPRHLLLTPRMVLTHTTGLPNWRFLAADRKLGFIAPPGETFGYSGEGFEALAQFAENKLAQPFESLVERWVFEPIGMRNVAISVREANFGNLAQAVDESGKFHGHYCRPNGWCRKEGELSAADDLKVTVEDYAAFLIAVMNAQGYDDDTAEDRDRVQVDRGSNQVIDCDLVPARQCPRAQGYGLGWEVLEYDDTKLIGHGGSDWAELARAYFYTRSKDGLLIFLNAPASRATSAMPDIIELLDPGSPMAAHYRMRLQRQTASD